MTSLPFMRWHIFNLLIAPTQCVLFLLIPPPDGLSIQGWYVLAIAIWMAIWWMTEAVPLAVTALLPILFFPLLGLFELPDVTKHYADPLIFLFLGGFILARAVSNWDLDRRLAGRIIRLAGDQPATIIASVMAVSAFLSMWVSNTATAMVMLPIALSITATVKAGSNDSATDFAPALLLGMAYAATIGGMGTLIGTPPNAIFAAFLENQFGKTIGFTEWMLVGVPILLVMLPTTWFILTHIVFNVGKRLPADTMQQLQRDLSDKAALNVSQKMVLAVLTLVVCLWLTRPVLVTLAPALPITDTTIALFGAVLLFVLPSHLSNQRFLLAWDDVAEIRWDVLILFGGGLALASAISDTDLAHWSGSHLQALASSPRFLFLICLGLVVVLTGELASNTAMAAILLPIVATIAVNMGTPPEMLMWPVALFATLGFMLPVATPPNAIVFGSHSLEISQMIRAGVWVDMVGILLVATLVLILGDELLISSVNSR